MNDFTASNGYVVRVIHENRVVLLNEDGESTLAPEFLTGNDFLDRGEMQALREFFQADADERLGRWRWPENPDYVVYDLGHDSSGFRYAQALFEPTGDAGRWQEGQQSIPPQTRPERLGINAVAAYFDAHPELKPWHEAQPGEGWIIDIGDEAYPNVQAVVVSNEGKFLFRDGHSLPIDRDYIRSGRRFHPEVKA